MDTIAERIEKLISALGVSKTEFARQVGVSQGFISQVCSGTSNLSPRTAAAICQKFDVNDEWLKNGTGDMFKTLTRDEEIAKFVGEALAGKDDDGVNNFKAQLIHVLSRLGEREWEFLADIAKELYEDQKED